MFVIFVFECVEEVLPSSRGIFFGGGGGEGGGMACMRVCGSNNDVQW